MDLKSRLESHSISTLRKEISKTNIKGYSKMKKAEVVALMLKHSDRFNHIQQREKVARKAPAPRKAPEPKKEEPKKVKKIIKKPVKKEEPKKVKKIIKKSFAILFLLSSALLFFFAITSALLLFILSIAVLEFGNTIFRV